MSQPMTLLDPRTGERIYIAIAFDSKGDLVGFYGVLESRLPNPAPGDLFSIPTYYPDLVPQIAQRLLDGSVATDPTFIRLNV